MQPERRMLLAAILLSLAQRDVANVRWLGVSPSKVKHLSEVISEESKRFVSSAAFVEMCEVVEVDAKKMREMTPQQAMESYTKITSDDWSRIEAS